MKTNGNDPVSPGKSVVDGWVTDMEGLSKREHFAALAMQGMLANGYGGMSNNFSREIADFAVNQADALIEALNKEGK